MKSVIASAVAVASMASDDVTTLFEQYIVDFNKTYTESEKAERLAYFTAALKDIEELKQTFPELEIGLTTMSDRSPAENDMASANAFSFGSPDEGDEDYKADMIGNNYNPTANGFPASVDYYNYNGKKCISHVRDIVGKECPFGSWAFATALVIEGSWCRKFGSLVPVSPQSLLDCETKSGGCKGGAKIPFTIANAVHSGACSEAEYPLEGKQGACRISQKCKAKNMVAPSGLHRVSGYEAKHIVEYLNQRGPTIMGIAVTPHKRLIHNYRGGNLTVAACKKAQEAAFKKDTIDHPMAVVGYKWDPVAKTTFFKVQNNWGPAYGDKGFMWLEFGACGWSTLSTGAANMLEDQPMVARRMQARYNNGVSMLEDSFELEDIAAAELELEVEERI